MLNYIQNFREKYSYKISLIFLLFVNFYYIYTFFIFSLPSSYVVNKVIPLFFYTVTKVLFLPVAYILIASFLFLILSSNGFKNWLGILVFLFSIFVMHPLTSFPAVLALLFVVSFFINFRFLILLLRSETLNH